MSAQWTARAPAIAPTAAAVPVSKSRHVSLTFALLRGFYLALISAVFLTKWFVGTTLARRSDVKLDPGAGGRLLASMFEKMGPTFIKLGQQLSSRPDLIGVDTATELARLRASVKSVPAGRIIETIEDSLGLPMGDLFERFDRIPVASGSVAQVHRAVLKHGGDVAVKVLKPRIFDIIAADFRVLKLGSGLLERLPGMRSVPLSDHLAEFEVAILAQVDLWQEARNNRMFKRHLESLSHVRIPELVPNMCSERVLTMEFLHDLTPVDTLNLDPPQRREAARNALELIYQMIFKDGFVHADLHPGNIFFNRASEIILLDFGLIATLDSTVRAQFQRFFIALATNDGELCAQIVQRSATSLSPEFDERAFIESMRRMVDQFAGRRVGEFQVADFAKHLFAIQRRFGVRGSTDFTLTILSLLVLEGIVKMLDPLLDFQNVAVRFLLSIPIKSQLERSERADVFRALRDTWHARSEAGT